MGSGALVYRYSQQVFENITQKNHTVDIKKFSLYHFLVLITLSVWISSSFYHFIAFESIIIFNQVSLIFSVVGVCVFLLYLVKRNHFLKKSY